MQTESEWHNKGQILVTTALMLTVLVGFMGLAIDAGYFFDYRRRMATAADSAAIAAVWELKRNPTPAPVMAARQAAAINGFTNGTDGITVLVNRPPKSGDYVGKSKYVEVLIKQPHPTFFMRALNIKSTTVAVRAVAGYNDQLGCIYALAPKADSALVISGTALIDAPSCSIYVNSTSSTAMKVSGGGCVQAKSINIAGGVSGGCASPTPETGVPPEVDPFADLKPPTFSTCTYPSKVSVGSGIATLGPGTYCGGLDINGGIVTFAPGLYIIQNGFKVSGSAIILGTGVTFYIDSGGLSITGSGSVTLSAPRSGSWEGILFFQNRSNTTQANIAGGTGSRLEGVLYFPRASLDYSGGSGTGVDYTVVVAWTLKFTGNQVFNINYTGLINRDPVKRPTLVE